MNFMKGLQPFHVVFIILFVRLLSVFLVQTWYVPDEYWQTLEVAHKHTFGYGALTWEWKYGIRSYLYPGIVMVLYSAMKFLGLDYPEALVLVPRIFQALLSAFADYRFYKWSGNRKWALFLILTSWFWFYTSGRTLLQTTETALVTISLSVFPFKTGRYDSDKNIWIWLACLCIFLRPTSVALWAVLVFYNLMTTNQSRVQLLLKNYVPASLISAAVYIALDSYFYGRLIVTPWEFFKFNILQDVASHYGTHPWYWYLTQGLSAVLGISIVGLIWAVYTVLRYPTEHKIGLLLIVAMTIHIILHSFVPHKEFRFMLPILPMTYYLIQDVIVPWSRKAPNWKIYTMASALLFGNLMPALYFGMIHQSGTLEVMPLLREAIPSNKSSVLFAMPCHSTPLYSHLHINVTTQYLNCDPPLTVRIGESDESERFMQNPVRWWRAEYANRPGPDFVVMFDKIKPRLQPVLATYRLLHEIPHTQFPQGEISEKVLMFAKSSRPLETDEVI